MRVLIVSFILWLSACSSNTSPDIKYFALPNPSFSSLAAGQVDVTLAPVLQDSRILLKDDNQIIAAHYHRWKINLAQNLAYVLKASVPELSEQYQLKLHVDQLFATPTGEVIFSGSWQVSNSQLTLHMNETFSYHQRQVGVGYQAFVTTLNTQFIDLVSQLKQAVTLLKNEKGTIHEATY